MSIDPRSGPAPPRIALLAEDPAVRGEISGQLHAALHGLVLQEFPSLDALQHAAPTHSCDLCVLHDTCQDRGLDLLDSIRERQPRIPVMVLLEHHDAARAAAARRHGAEACIVKSPGYGERLADRARGIMRANRATLRAGVATGRILPFTTGDAGRPARTPRGASSSRPQKAADRAALEERFKELNCLYAVSGQLADARLDWRQQLAGAVDAIAAGFQQAQAISARLRVEGIEITTPAFHAGGAQLFREIRQDQRIFGWLEVIHQGADRDPFLDEERLLVTELARRISEVVANRRYRLELDASRQRFQDFAEAASDWLWEMDEHLRFSYFSDRIQSVMAQPVGHWLGKIRRDLAVTGNPEEGPDWAEHIAEIQTRKPFRDFRYELQLPDGSTRHIAISGVPVFDENGEFRGYRGSGTDETSRVQAERRARETDQRLQGIAERLPGAVFQRLRKPDGRIEYPYMSHSVTEMVGHDISTLRANPMLMPDTIHPEDRPRFDHALDESTRTLAPMDLRFRMHDGAGRERWCWNRSMPRRLDNGDTLWDCIELDITEQKQAEARIQYLGFHDQLTGLPNRELFVERINQILPISARNRQPLAVAVLGLKRFRQVNKEFGMAGGDALLREAAARFGACLRPGDTVARLGGDRFLFLLPLVGIDPASHKPLERLLTAMEQPLMVDDSQILLSFTMGIALFPDDGDDGEALIQKADMAQAEIHRSGPGHGYRFHRDSAAQHHSRGLALGKDLRDAIEAGDQLRPYFQPVYRSRDGRLAAVETLARWWHPQHGLVSPGEFIPLAEDTGQIHALGMHILRQACYQAKAWQQAGLPGISITVNLSPRQLHETSLARDIRAVLQESGLAATELWLEITESTLIADLDRASAFMDELAADGVRFALDDFGVGYSSLSYLERLPVHAVKLDQSFVRNPEFDPRNATTIRAIVALAHALDLEVVAEGIETSRQAARLCELGCDLLQGFLSGRPMPAAELATLLSRREPLALMGEADAAR